jgi:hypothetical protein
MSEHLQGPKSEPKIGDDDLVTLAEACLLFFRGALSKSALRTEARKGNLEIIRIANKDFVTRNGVKTMIEKCRRPFEETLAPNGGSSFGLSDVEQRQLARDAVRSKLAKLRGSLRNTSL